jgi:hypothetical protein
VQDTTHRTIKSISSFGATRLKCVFVRT